MTITFDRIGLPSGDLPLAAKIIAVRGYRVEKEGKIDGKGHARRDAIEWLLPPLWPLKVITLPARGPRPKLKPETTLSLRLMDDVQIPRAVSYNRSEWRSFGKAQDESLRDSAYYQHDSEISPMGPREPSMATLRNPIPMNIVTAADRPVTLIVLKDGTIYIAHEYWVDGWRMHFIGDNGEEKLVALARIDLNQTVRLNRIRDVEFILQSKNRAGEP
ncbi:MAG TPA: hypothetical protein VFV92_07455 [Candidatus Bathyarchaeia archaeon]|nr:hypothetical protein [Candidatus Bathyarchaeia archaeon]